MDPRKQKALALKAASELKRRIQRKNKRNETRKRLGMELESLHLTYMLFDSPLYAMPNNANFGWKGPYKMNGVPIKMKCNFRY